MWYSLGEPKLYDEQLKDADKEKPPLNVRVLCYCNKYESVFKKDRQFVEYHIPMIGRFVKDNNRKYFDCEGSYYKVIEWCYLPYYKY